MIYEIMQIGAHPSWSSQASLVPQIYFYQPLFNHEGRFTVDNLLTILLYIKF